MTDNSPAGKAGVKQGDVIVGFNGAPVSELRDLTRAVASTRKGSVAKVDVLREGKSQTINVTIAAMPKAEQMAAAQPDEQEEQPAAKGPETGIDSLGLKLAPTSAETRTKYGLKGEVKGAVVVGILPDAPAAERGINVGDVIVGVGQDRVATVSDVVAKVKRASDSKQKAVLLLIDRKGNERFVPVPLSNT